MTTQDASTLTPPAPTKPAQRSCRWLIGKEISRSHLQMGMDAVLEVDMKRPDAELDYYRVEQIKDGERVVGYRLTKEFVGAENEHAAVTYDLDISFGGDPAQNWSCTCGDYAYRSRKRARAGQAPACKHVLALAAALKAIGLL